MPFLKPLIVEQLQCGKTERFRENLLNLTTRCLNKFRKYQIIRKMRILAVNPYHK